MIRIADLRKLNGLTQNQLAGILQIDQTTISNWERGKSLPDNVNQLKLANYFQVTIDYLLGRVHSDGNDKVILNASNLDLIEYAAQRGLEVVDIKEIIDFIDRMKNKSSPAPPGTEKNPLA